MPADFLSPLPQIIHMPKCHILGQHVLNPLHFFNMKEHKMYNLYQTLLRNISVFTIRTSLGLLVGITDSSNPCGGKPPRALRTEFSLSWGCPAAQETEKKMGLKNFNLNAEEPQ